MAAKPVIEVNGLSKFYELGMTGPPTLRDAADRLWNHLSGRTKGREKRDTVWALQDVTFSIQPGEVVGIIGRNGAGKSTLLKILARITVPTSGTAVLRGRVASLLEVGTGFHPELSGRENIYLSGAILGMRKKEIDRKLDQIIAFSEIERFIDTPVKRYSSGMYVRLAFSVAAHLEAEILLVDEVLAVGDAGFQKKCLGEMSGVAREGRTVIFVSHHMGAIQSLCDRAIWFDGGKAMFNGPTSEAINLYLKSLFGKSPNGEFGKNRQGDGRILFECLKIFNQAGLETGIVRSGESVAIEFAYKSREDVGFRLPVFHIFVLSQLGERLFTCSTRYAGRFASPLPPCGRLRCLLPKLPLRPGEYQLQLVSKLNDDLCDYIENAGSFTVVAGNFFDSHDDLSLRDAAVLVEQQWKLLEGAR